MVPEAGHYRNFIDPAETCRPAGVVRKRRNEIPGPQAGIMATPDGRGDRMH
nr:hypothetical protein [uncultured Arsenicibacter sp.]